MTKKRLFTIVLAALLLLITSFGLAFADTISTVVLTIPELCASNMTRASEALESLEGVEKVELDLNDTTATVTFVKYATDADAFRKAIEKIGLTVTSAVEQE